jgi:hypothetical protein
MDTTTVKAMATNQLRIPPGPTEQYHSTEELFGWMNENFARYGDIYRASVYGSNVYVVSAPEYCERILRRNWQNYPRKGKSSNALPYSSATALSRATANSGRISGA